ncbi:hypothetical protein V1514DRAFT_323551 [Lipomyces japonicus]|uniref:uncharacterized protein n=1 Tax=Lipomyces japonicus TaxID=56871 RepID=UPI0034CDFE68
MAFLKLRKHTNTGARHRPDASRSPLPSSSSDASLVQPGDKPTGLGLSLSGGQNADALVNHEHSSSIQAPLQSKTPNPQSAPPQFPWSQLRLNGTAIPFPRYGHTSSNEPTRNGEIYIFGGLRGAEPMNDLWVIECGSLNVRQIQSISDLVSPRYGHASCLVGNAFIIFGGDTRVSENDALDDHLYFLNTNTYRWSNAKTVGSRPSGRYGHSLNIIGSKLYVFGGQVNATFFNDLHVFDLNTVHGNVNSQWTVLKPQNSPSPRTNHSMVVYDEKLYLFGGTNGAEWFNDTWCFDPVTASWTRLPCVGLHPKPSEGHRASIVNGIMYIFGGRSADGHDLRDLISLKLSSRRWYSFKNMGPSPSARSGHTLTLVNKKIITLGGRPNGGSAPDLEFAYILDTSRIRYPPDQSPLLPLTEYASNKNGLENISPRLMQAVNGSNNANAPSPRDIQRPFSGDKNIRNQTFRPATGSSANRYGVPLNEPHSANPHSSHHRPRQQRLPRDDYDIHFRQQLPPPATLRQQRSSPDLRSSRAPGRSLSPLRDIDGNEIPIRPISKYSSAEIEQHKSFPESESPQLEQQKFQSPLLANTKPEFAPVHAVRSPINDNSILETPVVDGSTQDSPGNNDLKSFALLENSSFVTSRKTSPGLAADIPEIEIPDTQLAVEKNDAAEENLKYDQKISNADNSIASNEVSSEIELQRLRQANKWLEAELLMARQSGYKITSPSSLDNSQTSLLLPQNKTDIQESSQVLQAMLAMKLELEHVRTNVYVATSEASLKLTEMERQRDNAIQDNTRLSDEIASLEKQNQALITAASVTTITENNDTLQTLSTDTEAYEELQRTVNEQLEENERLRENLQNAYAELERANNEISSLQDELTNEQNHDDIYAAVEQVRFAILETESRASKLEKQVELARSAKAFAEQKLKDAREEVLHLQNRLEASEARIEPVTSSVTRSSFSTEKSQALSLLDKFLASRPKDATANNF